MVRSNAANAKKHAAVQGSAKTGSGPKVFSALTKEHRDSALSAVMAVLSKAKDVAATKAKETGAAFGPSAACGETTTELSSVVKQLKLTVSNLTKLEDSTKGKVTAALQTLDAEDALWARSCAESAAGVAAELEELAGGALERLTADWQRRRSGV